MEKALESIPDSFRSKNKTIFYGLDKAFMKLNPHTQTECENMAKSLLRYIKPVEQVKTPNINMAIISATRQLSNNNDFIRNFILNEMSDEFKQLLEGCQNIHKPEEVIIHCLNKLDFKQIVLEPYQNKRKELCYKPWFYITGLATILGYAAIKDVQKRYLSNNLVLKVREIASRQSSDLLNLASLPKNKVTDIGLTDYEGAKYLIDHVAHSNDSRFKPEAKQIAQKFQQMMNKIQIITGDVIDLLNHALVQYQLQQQQQRILQIESSPDVDLIRLQERERAEAKVKEDHDRLKAEIIEKDAQIKRERHTTVSQLFTKDRTKVRGYIYARKAPRGYTILSVKLGRTNNKITRAMQQNNALPIKEKYICVEPVEDAILAETIMHRFMDSYRARLVTKKSRKEWFYITRQGAIDLVRKVAHFTNSTFTTLDTVFDDYVQEYVDNTSYELNTTAELDDDSDEEAGYEKTEDEIRQCFVTELITELFDKNLTIKLVEQAIRRIAQTESFKEDKRIQKTVDYVIGIPDTIGRMIDRKDTGGRYKRLEIMTSQA